MNIYLNKFNSPSKYVRYISCNNLFLFNFNLNISTFAFNVNDIICCISADEDDNVVVDDDDDDVGINNDSFIF
jgi:hypothetical protein